MHISREVGLPVVKAFEGCLQPVAGRPGLFMTYYCPAGVLTLGYGHTNLGGVPPKINAATVWSQAECDRALANDMAKFERHVAALAPNISDQGQFDALVSWSFNTGGPADSSVWTYARKGDVAETVARLKRWNRAHVNGALIELPGLTRRRAAEAALFADRPDEALRIAGTQRASFTQMPQQLPRPKPPAAEIAKRAAPELGVAAAGAGTATVAKTQQPPPNPSPLAGEASAPAGAPEGALFYLGLAALAIAVILVVVKARKLAQDWA
jgi:lysozyme